MRARRQSRYWIPVAVGKAKGLARFSLHLSSYLTSKDFFCKEKVSRILPRRCCFWVPRLF